MSMNVHCYPVSTASAYVPLLFEGIEDRYRPICDERSLHGAFCDLERFGEAILHIHWEEFVLRDCRTSAAADRATAQFGAEIADFKRRGGTVFWTMHNELPHEIGFHRQFLVLRRLLAKIADRILVHNAMSIDVLSRQVDLDRDRVTLLPHPSYLGRHEKETVMEHDPARSHDGVVQCFGWIRRQKGISEMIDMLPPVFLEPRKLRIRVSGHGAEASAVMAQTPYRGDVEWDVRHVPDTQVPALLRSATCVVLPYERVLTSGVALLALSLGAILVAVDIPQMRELLPAVGTRLLYARGDGEGLRDRIDAVLSLAPDERAVIVAANVEAARALHPRVIARRLADLYDARPANAGSNYPA